MKFNINIPVCVSCQTIIGDIYPVFDEIRTRRIEEACKRENYEPTAVEGIVMGDVLDTLNIKNICCRKSILGFVREIPLH